MHAVYKCMQFTNACNLYPGVAKTLSFRKPFGTRSTITSPTLPCNTHALPGILYSATALQRMFYSLIVCRKRRSWRAEMAQNSDEFPCAFWQKWVDISQTAAATIKHSLLRPLSSSLHNCLIFTAMHEI